MDGSSALIAIVLAIGVFLFFRKVNNSPAMQMGKAFARRGWWATGYMARPDGGRDTTYGIKCSARLFEVAVDGLTGEPRFVNCPELEDRRISTAEEAEQIILEYARS